MNFRRFTTIIVLLPAMYMMSATTVLAGSESGFFLGGGVGNATVNDTVSNLDYSESDSGYKLYLGYNFGIIPLLDLGIEGSYVDFGKPTGTLSNGDIIQYKTTAWDAFGVAGLTLGPFGLFGKMGLVAWNSDTVNDAVRGNQSGTDPVYGIGVKFQILSISIRAEYEYFDLKTIDNISMASLGLDYTF